MTAYSMARRSWI